MAAMRSPVAVAATHYLIGRGAMGRPHDKEGRPSPALPLLLPPLPLFLSFFAPLRSSLRALPSAPLGFRAPPLRAGPRLAAAVNAARVVTDLGDPFGFTDRLYFISSTTLLVVVGTANARVSVVVILPTTVSTFLERCLRIA